MDEQKCVICYNANQPAMQIYTKQLSSIYNTLNTSVRRVVHQTKIPLVGGIRMYKYMLFVVRPSSIRFLTVLCLLDHR
jgi:hypothetical protein